MHGLRIGLLLAGCGALGPVAAGQVVLHSTLGIVNGQTYDRMDPDVYGASGYYGSIVDVESADDFTLASAATLTGVTLDYLTFTGGTPANGVEVNVWSDAAGTPGVLIYSSSGRPVVTALSFSDTVYGMAGRRLSTTISLSLAAGTYWLTMKPIDPTSSGDAYFSVRDSTLVNGAPTVGRDIIGNVYGWTSWTALPFPGNGGTTSMEIQGIVVPGPGVLAGLGAAIGVCGLKRRR